MDFYSIYRNRYHVPVNFYGVFLLVTFVPDFFGFQPSIITYSFWALKAALATWLILNYPKKIYNLRRREKLFFYVAIIYFINLFVDLFLQNYPVNVGNKIDILGFFLSILIALSFRHDPAFYSKSSFNFFLWSLGVGLLIAFFLAKESPPPLVGRFDANSTVNTINYGQMGCALSLIALYGFINRKIKYGIILYSLLFILGLISIMKAGSRSPVIVLLLVSVFYFFAKSGLLKGIVITSLAFLFLWLSLDVLIELSEAVGSSIVTRLMSALESGETSGRDMIYANAIQHFRNAPFFGNYYLIPSGVGKGGYPHNFFIEAFMTTGILGGVPFVIMVGLALKRCYILLSQKHKAGWIILLFLQMIIYGMFSSSLYSSQDFWALCFFILSMPSKPLRKKKKWERMKNLEMTN